MEAIWLDMVNLGGIDEPGHAFKVIQTVQTSQRISGLRVFSTKVLFPFREETTMEHTKQWAIFAKRTEN